ADLNGSDFWTQAKPNFFAGFQVLKNGNIVVSNWEGHGGGNGGKGFQLIEFDGGLTKVVSYWKQDPALVSSLHGVLVIDSLDTKNMHSDVNGILAPVNLPVSIEGASGKRASGHGSRKDSAVPVEFRERAFGISGRRISALPFHGASGLYVREAGR